MSCVCLSCINLWEWSTGVLKWGHIAVNTEIIMILGPYFPIQTLKTFPRFPESHSFPWKQFLLQPWAHRCRFPATGPVPSFPSLSSSPPPAILPLALQDTQNKTEKLNPYQGKEHFSEGSITCKDPILSVLEATLSYQQDKFSSLSQISGLKYLYCRRASSLYIWKPKGLFGWSSPNSRNSLSPEQPAKNITYCF